METFANSTIIWDTPTDPIGDLKKTMALLDKLPPFQIWVPESIFPPFDNVGGYFKNGKWITLTFKEFMQKVIDKSLPDSFKPKYNSIGILPDGMLFPFNDDEIKPQHKLLDKIKSLSSTQTFK